LTNRQLNIIELIEGASRVKKRRSEYFFQFFVFELLTHVEKKIDFALEKKKKKKKNRTKTEKKKKKRKGNKKKGTR
jgi:hypothetical protein